MAREVDRAIREHRSGGHRLHCGGCNAFVRAVNAVCSCGFANDIRGRRNHGRWGEAVYTPGFGASDDEMPF